MKHKKHLTDCKITCLFKKETRKNKKCWQRIAVRSQRLPGCQVLRAAHDLHTPKPGQALTALTPSTPEREGRKKPQQVCCRNSSVLHYPERWGQQGPQQQQLSTERSKQHRRAGNQRGLQRALLSLQQLLRLSGAQPPHSLKAKLPQR